VHPEAPAIELLECNQPAYRVFRYAKPDYLVGMGGAVYQGPSTSEIRQVCEAIAVPFNEDLLWRIRVLDAAYADEKQLRQQASKKTKPR